MSSWPTAVSDMENPQFTASELITSFLVSDACHVGPDTDPRGEGHVIGAAIFRSPEALLGLKWATPTDIWSFGATVKLPHPPCQFTILTQSLPKAHQPALG
jgi:hypothetical protein